MNVPSGPSNRSYAPDPTYQMSTGDRGKIMSIFDPEALERLISMLPTEDRRYYLAYFQYPDGDMAEPPPKLVKFDDPNLQAVLEEVWVPYWSTMPQAALYVESQIPGRHLALARLQVGQ